MSYTSTPELLDDFTEKCTDILQEEDVGLDPEKAKMAAQKIARYIKNDWGGQQIYFPKCAEDQLSERDKELWNKFDGTNQAELAHDFGVSLAWVYKIVKYMRASEIADKQTDAFPDDELQKNPTRRCA
ncbi:MAG: hypothetical protein COA54_02300 [Thiotrichaceae bacterium]|nr:MAG: hypothetical protein COA54_02300 [Thiotrichaceae bacterium]